MVGKSKVISGLSTHQAFRRRKDTVMGSSVGPDTHAKFNDPKGTIGERFEPSFHAGLTNNDLGRLPGGDFLSPTFTRGTPATYVNVYGQRVTADPNESRQEFASGQPIGTLLELATTNNFWNSAAPATQNVNLTTGDHTFSVFGTGSLTSANAGGTATGHGAATEGNPVTINVTAAGEFSFTVAGSLSYAQVEAGPVASSIILTGGASGSRDTSRMAWPTSSIIGTQGMVAVIWKPNFSQSDLQQSTNLSKKIVSTNIQVEELIRYQQEATNAEFFRLVPASSFAQVAIAPKTITAGQIYLIAMRWVGAGAWQIGFKNGGTWQWGTQESAFPGFSAYTELRLSDPETAGNYDPMYGSHYRDLYAWPEIRDTAWIESFFSGVAN